MEPSAPNPVSPKPPIEPQSIKVPAPKNRPRPTRFVQRHRRSLGKFLVTGAAVLLLIGVLAGVYEAGRNSTTGNLEQTKQTVVQEGDVIADVAQRLSPSVVSIVTRQSTVSGFTGQTRTSQAAGTGVIIDESGLILTNKHVVPEGTSAVQIVMADGKAYEDVEIIGRDPLNDLAILKVKGASGLKAATLADSDQVRTGQKVIAIGNALGQFQNTVTSGIISGIGRPIEAGDENGSLSEQLTNLFQTDAAINSGNSGGPLLNYNGEVIGINTAVAADAENIGFAIPINEAKGIIGSVQSTGKLSRPFIGVQYTMLSEDGAKQLKLSVSKGAYISTNSGSIVSGSPAEKAGLKPGDVITKVNSTELTNTTSLTSVISRYKVGDEVQLTIVRDGKEQKVSLKLAEAPSN